jgi:hypothetical protein
MARFYSAVQAGGGPVDSTALRALHDYEAAFTA